MNFKLFTYRIETTQVIDEVNRIQREVESSRDLLEYFQQQDDGARPRFGFVALNNFLFPTVTTTITMNFPTSFVFTTIINTRTVSLS